MFMKDYMQRKDIVASELDRIFLVQSRFSKSYDEMRLMPCSRFDMMHDWLIEQMKEENGGMGNGEFSSIGGVK